MRRVRQGVERVPQDAIPEVPEEEEERDEGLMG